MFAGAKSMAIVGSASSVMTHSNGELIDSHDIVVRFNRATTTGVEKHVGSRTDIVVANEANSLKKAPPPSETVDPRCVITYVKTTALRSQNTHWHKPYFDWVGNTPVLISTGPEILSCDVPLRQRGFSMGTYAIASLPYWLSIEKLFVTGFTMFGSVSGGAMHYCKPPTRVANTWHDAELERTIFGRVLSSLPCEVTTTEEVSKMRSDCDDSNLMTSKQVTGFDHPVHRYVSSPMLYVAERFSKLLLTLGYLIRRCTEKTRLRIS